MTGLELCVNFHEQSNSESQDLFLWIKNSLYDYISFHLFIRIRRLDKEAHASTVFSVLIIRTQK